MSDAADMEELLLRNEDLERAIALKDLELGCAHALLDENLYRADLGWLITTVPGAGGALLAVASGRQVSALREELSRIAAERAELLCERLLIEDQITSF